MPRELSDESVRHQAEQFIAWSSKRDNDHVDAFKRWADSKDLGSADRKAIARAVRGKLRRDVA